LKWFKHHTDSLDDPFIQELMDEYSHLGYAIWFGLIEIICKETGKDLTKEFECSPKYLRRKLRTSLVKLRQVLEYCQTSGRLLVDFSGEKWKFQIPKIAEIKDNYTKDLQVTSKKLSLDKEEEIRIKRKKKKKNNKDKPFLSDSEEYRLAELLLTEIRKNNPGHKQPNLQTWAKHIDLILRIDNRSPKEVSRVIRWCQKDDFWQQNILSTIKLREKYDQLAMKMKYKKGGNNGRSSKPAPEGKYSNIRRG
jgi:hypothetical protein